MDLYSSHVISELASVLPLMIFSFSSCQVSHVYMLVTLDFTLYFSGKPDLIWSSNPFLFIIVQFEQRNFAWDKSMHILTASSCSALGLSVRNLNAAVSAVDVVWILAKSSPNKSSRLAQASPLTHQPRDPRNPSFLAFLPPSSHQACVSKRHANF